MFFQNVPPRRDQAFYDGSHIYLLLPRSFTSCRVTLTGLTVRQVLPTLPNATDPFKNCLLSLFNNGSVELADIEGGQLYLKPPNKHPDTRVEITSHYERAKLLRQGLIQATGRQIAALSQDAMLHVGNGNYTLGPTGIDIFKIIWSLCGEQ